MRKFEQSLPDLLLDVYEAAANPQHRQVVLRRIANEMEATKASIHVHAFASQSWTTHTAGTRVHRIGYDESAAGAYANYYAVRDPYIHRIRERFPHDGSGTSSDLLTTTELRRTEFYSDYGRPTSSSSWVGQSLSRMRGSVPASASFALKTQSNSLPNK
jgi:hypothetical protein